MRRPLFGTGLPQVTPPSPATLLALPPNPIGFRDRTVLVTLYAIRSGEAVSVLARNNDTAESSFVSQFDADITTIGNTVLLCENFPVRGNVDVLVGSGMLGGDVIFGYYQIDGEEQPTSRALRPLQPSLSVAGGNYAAKTVAPAPAAGAQIHAFSTSYIDVVTLRGIGLGGSWSLIVSDGVGAITIVYADNLRAFMDGIPFRAGSPNAVGGFAPGIHIQGILGGASAWGTFTRA